MEPINILYAVLVLLGSGALVGVLLALASYYLGVKKDETVEKIRAHLPGVNCGACGYTGCDKYAEAIAAGEAKSNLCVPGGDTAAAEIAEVLGIEALDVMETVAFVRCNGQNGNVTRDFVFDAAGTCAAQCLLYGGSKACTYSCLGCGDCARVCPNDAIHVINGVAVVDREKCIGCGLCAKECPKGIISIIPLASVVGIACSNKEKGAIVNKKCKVGCIACRRCEKACPVGAITVEDNLASIDYGKCIKCGKCAEVCPKHCIVSFSENGK